MRTARAFLQAVFLGLIGLLGAAASAEGESPDALVRRTVEEVLDAIQRTPERAALQQVAEQKVLPNFDFREMTRLAVGPNWRKASPQQQSALESEFRRLLVNLYTGALSKTGQRNVRRTVEVKPLPPGARQDDALVRTVVKDPDGRRVAIDYRMASRDGRWRVYDVLVEGVSLVTNYRSTFDREIDERGVDGLIRALEQKNGAVVRS